MNNNKNIAYIHMKNGYLYDLCLDLLIKIELNKTYTVTTLPSSYKYDYLFECFSADNFPFYYYFNFNNEEIQVAEVEMLGEIKEYAYNVLKKQNIRYKTNKIKILRIIDEINFTNIFNNYIKEEKRISLKSEFSENNLLTEIIIEPNNNIRFSIYDKDNYLLKYIYLNSKEKKIECDSVFIWNENKTECKEENTNFLWGEKNISFYKFDNNGNYIYTKKFYEEKGTSYKYVKSERYNFCHLVNINDEDTNDKYFYEYNNEKEILSSLRRIHTHISEKLGPYKIIQGFDLKIE